MTEVTNVIKLVDILFPQDPVTSFSVNVYIGHKDQIANHSQGAT